ncbi:MAG: patatin [Spartobacteria bacterium]|nr:patatin [Spartobacteria bacterium]
MKPTEKKIGLVLGSGAARGLAHLGVIKALKELEVPIHCVAGTSIGALMGAVFVADKCEMLEELALEIDWKRSLYFFVEMNFPRSGLIDGVKIERLLRDILEDRAIERLPIPYRAVATDILTGNEVVIDRGDLVKAVRASIAIPGIFTPVCRDGQVLLDGGLVNPLPVSVARAMGADEVIAVEINLGMADIDMTDPPYAQPVMEDQPTEDLPGVAGIKDRFLRQVNEQIENIDSNVFDPIRKWFDRESTPHVFDILTRTIRIMENQVTLRRLENEAPDLLIQPEVGAYESLDFSIARAGIAEGYRAAMDMQEDLLALVHSKTSWWKPGNG